MRTILSLTAMLVLAATPALGHFVFVVPLDGGKVRVVLSDDLQPDEGVNIGPVANIQLVTREIGGKDRAIVCEKGEHALTAAIPGDGTRLVYGSLDYGVNSRGNTKPHLLRYHPKAILGEATDKATLGDKAVLEIVPEGKPGTLTFRVLSKGKPVADAEVTVMVPGKEKQKVATDKDGRTPAFAETGRYGVWTKLAEAAAGEAGGKKYEEIRHYATLVVDVAKARAAALAYPPLPTAVSSFGAAVCDGWLYVYGGHSGKTHQYSTESAAGTFRRLKLDGGKEWEDLPGGPASQGLALVVYKSKLYRVGGMQPRNKPGDKADNHSLAACARFDPATKKWEDLPDLPAGRSSHDAVVLGDTLYVVGGWSMNGAAVKPEWQTTALSLDLSARSPKWESVEQPFKRRALTAAAHDGKVWVFGGLTEDALDPAVNVYDPVAKKWSSGPAVPAPLSNSFTPASCVCGGKLYLSTADGKVWRMTPDAWEEVATLKQARSVHRVVPGPDGQLVAIGGASRGSNVALTELVVPSREGKKPPAPTAKPGE